MRRWAGEKLITITVVINLGNWTRRSTILVLFYFSGAKENVKPENVPVSLPFLFWFGQIFQDRSSKSGTSYERILKRRLRAWGQGVLSQEYPFLSSTEECQRPEPEGASRRSFVHGYSISLPVPTPTPSSLIIKHLKTE